MNQYIQSAQNSAWRKGSTNQYYSIIESYYNNVILDGSITGVKLSLSLPVAVRP